MEQVELDGGLYKRTIHDLDNPLLMKIFSYLNIRDKLRVEQVCRRWLEVSKLGWPDVDKEFDLHQSDFSVGQLKTILCRCGRFLEKINIVNGSMKEIRRLKLVEKYCRNVNHLNVSFDWPCKPTLQPSYYDTLATVLGKNENLEHFEMKCFNVDMIGDDFLENINAGALKSLSLIFIVTYGSDLCHPPANICRFRKLESLKLFELIIEEESLDGFGELVELIKLDLSYSDLPIKYIEMIKNFKKLEELILCSTFNTKIHDRSISAIVKNCLNLRHIVINGLNSLTDDCFVDISKLNNLRTLYMDSLPKVTNRAVRNLSQLEELSCNGCQGIDHNGFKQLIEKPNLKLLRFEVVVFGPTFLEEINKAILRREENVKLHFYHTNFAGGDPYTMPANCSPLLVIHSD